MHMLPVYYAPISPIICILFFFLSSSSVNNIHLPLFNLKHLLTITNDFNPLFLFSWSRRPATPNNHHHRHFYHLTSTTKTTTIISSLTYYTTRALITTHHPLLLLHRRQQPITTTPITLKLIDLHAKVRNANTTRELTQSRVKLVTNLFVSGYKQTGCNVLLSKNGWKLKMVSRVCLCVELGHTTVLLISLIYFDCCELI